MPVRAQPLRLLVLTKCGHFKLPPRSARCYTQASVISEFPCLQSDPLLQAVGFCLHVTKEKRTPSALLAEVQTNRWLAENGPRELEFLFRAITFNPSVPILLADSDRHYREASVGAGKLLGLPREQIIGHAIDDFAQPSFKPQVRELWDDLLEVGQQEGTLRLLEAGGNIREVDYIAKGNVLPERHLLVLRDKSSNGEAGSTPASGIPSWVQDYALYLLDEKGHVVTWYSGAERIYGYRAEEVMGHHISFLYAAPGNGFNSGQILRTKLQQELEPTASDGHLGTEGLQAKRDGSPFWANVITMALRDQNGDFTGASREWRATLPNATKETKGCSAAGHVGGCRGLNRRWRVSSRVSLRLFRRPTIFF